MFRANQDTFFAAITVSDAIKKKPCQSYEGAILIHNGWRGLKEIEADREIEKKTEKNSEIKEKKQHGADGYTQRKGGLS